MSMTVIKTDDEGWPQQGFNMHAQLLTHDSRASAFAVNTVMAHGNYVTYSILLSN